MDSEVRLNREWVLAHLREACESLAETISQIEQDGDYADPEFFIAIQHVYNHLNTAWNSRAVSQKDLDASGSAEFSAWRRFPNDLDL